jgi:hypothetical protein
MACETMRSVSCSTPFKDQIPSADPTSATAKTTANTLKLLRENEAVAGGLREKSEIDMEGHPRFANQELTKLMEYRNIISMTCRYDDNQRFGARVETIVRCRQVPELAHDESSSQEEICGGFGQSA